MATNNNIDDLISHMDSMKISALRKAAIISPYVREVTIGPNSKVNLYDTDEGKENKYTHPHDDVDHSDTPRIIIKLKNDIAPQSFKPDLKVYVDISNDNIPARNVELINSKVVSCRNACSNAEKKRTVEHKLNMERQQEKFNKMYKQREVLVIETQKQLNLNTEKLSEEIENEILQVVAEEDGIAREFAETKRLDKAKLEARLKEVHIQLDNDKMRRLQKTFKETIEQNKIRFVSAFKILSDRMKTKEQSPQMYEYFTTELKKLITTFEQLMITTNGGTFTKTEVDNSEQCVSDIEGLCAQIDIEHEKLLQSRNDAKKMEEQDKRTAAEQAAKNQQLQLQKEQKQKQQQADHVDNAASVPLSIKSNLENFISKERLDVYLRVRKFFNDYSMAVVPLEKEVELKKFRFDCQKAVNIPVNAISAVNGKHLFDKYQKLDKLLSGQPIKVADTMVEAGQPLAQIFCKLILAKKMVGQGDTMISSNPRAAFPIAAVLVSLWQKYPDLGELFLYFLYKECPYLVPYFIPQLEGYSTKDYYQMLGYRYVDDVLETQDMYLKRMAGIARLYAAILVTKLRQGETAPHPHGLENGWIWLTNILNLEPLPDICATLIFEVLQIAGPAMLQLYGSQFNKMLSTLQSQYFPKLSQIDEGGPKARLEGFLIKIFKEGTIEQPDGILPDNFW